MVEMLVDQVRFFLQKVGVQDLHNEAEGQSIQLGAQVLWKILWSREGQEVSTNRCASTRVSCVQRLTKLVAV